MDKTLATSERLAIEGGASPSRRFPPRPDRYEVDVETPLSPPGSSSYLLFDSSSLFSSHPPKYRLLVKRTSKDDLAATAGSGTVDRDGHKTSLGHRRSRSLVSLPTLERESPPSTAGGIPGGASDPKRDRQVLDQFLGSESLSRRKESSEPFGPDVGENLREPYLLPFDQHSHKNKSVVDNPSRNIKNVVTSKEDNPVSFQIQPFEESDNSMSSGSATPKEEQQTVPAPATEGAIPQYLVKEVQPEPRRLFGFGPLYRPLPEVVVQKQHQHPLTERVKQEGISAIGKDQLDAPSGPQRKTSTGKETSMWMPFSF